MRNVSHVVQSPPIAANPETRSPSIPKRLYLYLSHQSHHPTRVLLHVPNIQMYIICFSMNVEKLPNKHSQSQNKLRNDAKRQFKILEKSFELEKQKITEEVLIAREDTTRVEFNNYLDEALLHNPEKK